MNMPFALIGISLVVFVTSFAMGFLWYRIRFGLQAAKQVLQPGMAVLIKTSTGMYRSRFAGEIDSQFRFESILCRQSFVPIRVGELVTVEAATSKGILLFRSNVIDRDEVTHELIIRRPKTISNIDRRDAERFACDDLEVIVKLDGVSVQLIDVSAKGAKLRAKCEFAKGERVLVKLPWLLAEVGAWVIATEHCGRGEDACAILRIVFEKPAQLPRKSALNKAWT